RHKERKGNERSIFYEVLNEVPNRLPPNKDVEISKERNKFLRRNFPSAEERKMTFQKFVRFSGALDDRWFLDPKSWWLVHGASIPLLQNLALKLLGQPLSSSFCERNWTTYLFIHSMRRNKIDPQRVEDLNERTICGILEVMYDSFEGDGVLEFASLSLDESDIEM
ncbi:hypothetical protein J1N35_034052, partial [Gossypium stocksii]